MGRGREQRRARRELERRMRELDRLDAKYGLGAMPGPRPVARRSPAGRRVRVLLGAICAVVATGAVLAVVPGSGGAEFRRITGINRPDRLAPAVVVPTAVGSVRYLKTQPGSYDPVSYSPCREIHYVINPDGGPADYRDFIDPAIAEASARSGFVFVYDGTTDDRDFDRERPRSRPPVLIGFSLDGQDEGVDFERDAIGLGGSTMTDVGGGFLEYVTGMIALESDWFARASRKGDRAGEQAVVMHELGHVLGLGHVDDPGELMNADNIGRTTYGPGDLEGLARLGSVECQ